MNQQETLDPSLIKRDGGTQSRAGINQDTVAEYAESMRDGAKFPAVTVFYDGDAYWLGDGFHRVLAAIEAGVEIAADIRQGQRRDAVLYSAGANADHGLRRTNEDKRRAVLMLLNDEEWSQWSNYEIAKRCRVSESFARNVRKVVTPPITHETQTRKFERNGKTYEMDVSKVGSAQQEKTSAQPVRIEPLTDAEKIECAILGYLDSYGLDRMEWLRVIGRAEPSKGGMRHVTQIADVQRRTFGKSQGYSDIRNSCLEIYRKLRKEGKPASPKPKQSATHPLDTDHLTNWTTNHLTNNNIRSESQVDALFAGETVNSIELDGLVTAYNAAAADFSGMGHATVDDVTEALAIVAAKFEADVSDVDATDKDEQHEWIGKRCYYIRDIDRAPVEVEVSKITDVTAHNWVRWMSGFSATVESEGKTFAWTEAEILELAANAETKRINELKAKLDERTSNRDGLRKRLTELGQVKLPLWGG